MKNVVMGTAGHIDHGKTTLVKRLTGVDTDRLEEEKRRGMTIQLGFAPLTLPSSNTISIIDVPGHEKFIKTMVSGVTGIDFVLFVIAADEGIMPQTLEHLQILSLLGISRGVVALTKCDIVDAEFLQLVLEDIRKTLLNSTLKDAKIIPVSSRNGDGIPTLIDELEQLTKEASKKNVKELFRLPLDRIFTKSGHGTIVTGTVQGGEIAVGDAVFLQPTAIESRVRGIQVHNTESPIAAAGDRCAIVLASVDKDKIKRGDVLIKEPSITATSLMDVSLNLLKDDNIALKHNERLHVNIGTKEVIARIRLIGADEAHGGKSIYAQLRLEESVVAIKGDRFLIRAYSPVKTIGGGVVLAHKTANRHRFTTESTNTMQLLESGTVEEIINHYLGNLKNFAPKNVIWSQYYFDGTSLDAALLKLVDSNNILYFKSCDKYISKNTVTHYKELLSDELSKVQGKNGLTFKYDKEEIRSKLFRGFETKDFNVLLDYFVSEDLIAIEGNYILDKTKDIFSVIAKQKQTSVIEGAILSDGIMPRSISRLSTELLVPTSTLKTVIDYLSNIGKIARLNEDLYIASEAYNSALAVISSILKSKGTITAAETRDALKTNRAIAIALLEHTDSLGVTERHENLRKPGIRFMDSQHI